MTDRIASARRHGPEGAVSHGDLAAEEALPPGLYGTTSWSETLLSSLGVPVEGVRFASVGGGLGSFALVDQLRIRGVPQDEIAVVGAEQHPYESFRRYARNSQLPDEARIRSDSATRIDNPWGFPSYAMSEARRTRRLGPVLRVVVEPVLARPFAPRAADVYAGVDREAGRIGWRSMLRQGRAMVVRPARGGGFYVAYRPENGDGGTTLAALRCESVHLSLGHDTLDVPGVPGLPPERVVHSYGEHSRVYADIVARGGGTVVVRGAGITASQVVGRLLSDRAAHGLQTKVIHVIRTGAGRRLPTPRTQPFSAPRSAFGGQLHQRLERLQGTERDQLRVRIRQTTTPKRRQWRLAIAEAYAEGAYETVWATDVAALAGADWVVDCTGFTPTPTGNPVLADLGAWVSQLDPAGREDGPLGVDENCALVGAAGVAGGIYLSGTSGSSGPIGPVDSFWGLTYAGLVIAGDQARRGRCPRLGPASSFRAWRRWMRGAEP